MEESRSIDPRKNLIISTVYFKIARVFLTLAGIAVSAAAGAAAAATGYSAYGVPSTGHGLSLGALAGVMQSVILFFIEYVLDYFYLWPRGPLESLLRALVCGVIISLPITGAVSNLAIGEVPGAFLAAGCVAALALPVQFLGFLPWANVIPRDRRYGCCRIFGYFCIALGSLGFGAVAGCAFAAMAKAQGHYICPNGVAAAAGAVYATLTSVYYVSLLILGWCLNIPYKVDLGDPIVIA